MNFFSVYTEGGITSPSCFPYKEKLLVPFFERDLFLLLPFLLGKSEIVLQKLHYSYVNDLEVMEIPLNPERGSDLLFFKR